jgi:hypothetical protein
MTETLESLYEQCAVAGCESPAVARFEVLAEATQHGAVPAATWQPAERVPLCEDHAVQLGEAGLGRPTP